MNAIDIIVLLILLLALWNGWRQGFVVQVCSLGGIVAGIWLAVRYGHRVGVWFGTEPQFADAVGFAAVLVAVIIAVAVVARLLRRVFRFAGLGLLDILLGIVVAVVKYLLILSALFAVFDRINADGSLVEHRVIERSKCYGPIMRLSDSFLPFLEQGWEAAVPEKDADHGEEI